MEAKLMQAAAVLPTPTLEFEHILLDEQKKRTRASLPRMLRRALLAAVLILCLGITVFAYGKTHYGLWSGYSSSSFADVKILSQRYDYIFPEQLGGRPFLRMSTTLGAPQGASHLEAILTPTYKLHSVNYGRSANAESQITVSFGTTEQETWKYHFSVADDGSCTETDVNPGSQSAAEYQGYIVHLYAIEERYSVRWEDETRKLVLDVTCLSAENFETVLEAAKLLIDLNR